MRCLLLLLSFCRIASAAVGYLEIPASGKWDGNDGPWSSFDFFIGHPLQRVRLLPSTSSSFLMPLSAKDCAITGSASCNLSSDSRYSSEISTSYNLLEIGRLPIFPLPIVNDRVYFNGQSQWGQDSLSIQQDMTVLNSTFVGEMYNFTGYSTGMFGVLCAPGSLAGGALYPSLMSDLKAQGVVTSHSWSYTAGVASREQPGSFIFGGYDQSRFDPANSIMTVRSQTAFNDTLTTNINVTLLSIVDDAELGGNLMSTDQRIITRINTDVPQIWLPFEICERFEGLYNITWNPDYNLFLLDDGDVATLKQRNSTLMFRVAANATSTASITVEMPLSSLILSIKINDTNHPYFPIRCTNDSSEFTLGRTFFQAAYLTVNFDDRTLKLSKARYPGSNFAPKIVSILPESSHSVRTRGVIVGSVLGPLIPILILILVCLLWKRGRGSKLAPAPDDNPRESGKPELAATPIDAPPAYRRRHSSNATTRSEVDGTGTMVMSHLDPLSEVNEAAEKTAGASPVELEAEPVQVSELYGGFDGTEMGVEGSREEGRPLSLSYHDESVNHVEEPVSPLRETEASGVTV